MEGADGVGMGNAGRDHLPAARISGHEVRLHETRGNAQVGLHEPAIELDGRCQCRRRAEVHVRRVVEGVVVHDGHPVQNPGIAHEFGEFGALVRSVQTGGNEHRDGVGIDPRREQGLD